MYPGEQTFDKKSHGVLYGQEVRTPHLMRGSLIIVLLQVVAAGNSIPLLLAERMLRLVY
jgi:hypothetical protein